VIDKYNKFEQLLLSEKENVDFIRRIKHRNSSWLIATPHGGGIEPGTSEIANAIAGFAHSLYIFEGIRSSGNNILHITSTQFDDPQLLKLLNSAKSVLALHGCSGNEQIAYVGGLLDEVRDKIIEKLNQAGIKAEISSDRSLQGRDANNICNKGTLRKGIQIELSESLRMAMFLSLSRSGRRAKTKLFKSFVKTIREIIKEA
jgi:phage replication-related protein YjqB (UPF0714/DUF867 family)